MTTLRAFAFTLPLVALPFVRATAQQHGEDLDFDFKMTTVGTSGMQNVNSSTGGHAIVSKGRVRMKMNGLPMGMTVPGTNPTDSVAILVLDSGKNVVYLLPQTKQFMRMNPAEVMDRAQKMLESMGGSMTFDFTDEPKVENLGAGPDILGYKTVHYRTTTGVKTTMSTMGQAQTMSSKSVTDQYVAPELKASADAFAGMSSNGMAGMFAGPKNKAYIDKMKAIREKLGSGTELKAEVHSTMEAGGMTASMTGTREVTAIRKVTATDDMFAIPAGYKQIELPFGPGASR